MCKIILHKTIGGFEDELVQQVWRKRDLAQTQMKRAAGVARVAQIFFRTALFQHRRLQAQLRRAIGGDQTRDAAADDDYVCYCNCHISICLYCVLIQPHVRRLNNVPHFFNLCANKSIEHGRFAGNGVGAVARESIRHVG